MRMTAPPTRMTAPPMRITAPPTRTTAPPMRMTAPPTRMTAPPTRMTAPPMRVNWEENRGRPKPPPRPTARRSPLQAMLEQSMLQISVAAVIAGSLGWSWLIYSEFRSPVLVAPAIAAVDPAAVDVTSNVVKSAGTSAYARIERPSASGTGNRPPSGESAASIVAREWSFFEPKHLAEGARAALRQAAREQRIAKESTIARELVAAKEPKVAKETAAAKEPKIAKEPAATKEPRVAKEITVAKEAAVAKEPAAAKETRIAKEITVAKETAVAKEPAAAKETRIAKEITVAKETAVAKEPAAAKETRIAKEITVAKEAAIVKEPAAVKEAVVVKEAAAAKETARSLIHLAALETVAPQYPPLHAPSEPGPSRIPFIGARTSLVDFETAPFPYHGAVPGSNRPFLSAGEDGHRGHANFRGRVFWESPTFSDDRVLLHIPPGFDPKRPAVMVVFFHGHGANLARDVRDRQQVPAQLTAAGTNAVLVAPQFAVNAADSSAGKFWEPNGFKRFLDEAAVKLANLYGDQRSTAAFANMPIVIVAYSGGFGPTLSVLDRGGVRSRVRGLVLLDALYGGIDRFADWIANNRSTFFVSSYTPHTAGHNAHLEHLLRQRDVPYDSELRRSHLRGMVAFLPAGPISHRDFVNRAWAEAPIKDVLLRMEDVGPHYANTETTASLPAAALAGRRD
jgi:hypothetical protein